ncbi:PREDICTED: EF-hand and coiled-coil domain-containing protein 1 [Capra hircus]|uniref:EF-hand and coiled-coil domain-containing protein 1 n=1 Tax=Capra hircus TaxID=9925 RepID=UPI000846A2D0|nr:PREDICTED: EF-hand and coiled-coil domain-containing protein 1 [Capra hircus]
MEGAARDPYRRPARRTQWLLSALAHHYGLDRGVENEIVVLATGLDQYLQEVFHHLDCRGAGRLPRADFRALCAVLGLRFEGSAAPGEASGDTAAGDTNSGDVISGDAAAGEAAEWDEDAEEEARLALRAEPPELTFRQFHARLCGYFGTRAGPRLPRGALSEHIETQIRLRRPRRRRRRAARPPGPDSGPDGERLARLEEENSSLRELVEDLRAALQSSDARCLALQVGLWKSQEGAQEAARGEPEAAARELRQARGALAAAEAHAGRLRRGQAEVRRRAEEAREAVLRSLGRVRELEALARQVPGLQRGLRRLEGELRRYRSEGTQLPSSPRASPEPHTKSSEPEDGETRGPEPPREGAWGSNSRPASRPPDQARASPGLDEQLFRSVEGQAASDEEDDREKWREARRPPAEVTALLAGLSGCRSRCDDQMAKKLMTCFSHLGGANHARALGELEACVAMLVEQLGSRGCGAKTLRTPEEEAELQQKVGENESLRQELQLVETERVRLSLLEEKLEDVLGLLQKLRDLNISKKALGKILLSTLDACRDPAHDRPSGPSAVLEALRQALAGCELLRREPSAPASTSPALTHSFPISC